MPDGFASSGFFVTGGTLPADAPSYVERQADTQLRQLVEAGRLCYILTSRQMGKSSLMERTVNALREKGVYSARVDLSRLGKSDSIDRWYTSFLFILRRELGLSTDVVAWWKSQDDLTHTARLAEFFETVIPSEIESSFAVFIDEVDAAIKLDFADDFFAAIRHIYERGIVSSRPNRPTFVLIGTVKPGELISDPKHTPFNIGEPIGLDDFTHEEAAPLAKGLGIADSERAGQILQRILYWTDGHPYLTQRLCQDVAAAGHDNWSKKDIDNLVHTTFTGEDSLPDSNLTMVGDMLTAQAPDRDAVLLMYRDIYRGWGRVPDNEQSSVKTHLKLSGVVKRRGELLSVRNSIYRDVFDKGWINEHLSGNWWGLLPTRIKVTAVGIVLSTVLLALATVAAFWNARLAGDRANLALSQQLITQSAAILDQQYDLSLLLALEALGISNTPETEEFTRYALASNPYVSAYLRGHDDRVNVVASGLDGRLIASGSDDGKIILWDSKTRLPVTSPLDGHSARIGALAFTHDGTRLVSGACAEPLDLDGKCAKGQLGVWNLAGEDLQGNFVSAHLDEIGGVGLNADDSVVVSIDKNDLIMRRLDDLQPIWTHSSEGEEELTDMASSPVDPNLLVFGNSNGSIGVVSIGERTITRRLEGPAARITAMAFSPDGRILGVGDDRGVVTLWDAITWELLDDPFPAHSAAVHGIQLFGDGRIITVGGDRRVLVWRRASDAAIDTVLEGHRGSVTNIAAYGENGVALLVSNGPDNSVIVWNLEGDWPRGSWLTEHQDAVLGLGFSPDGSVLASASRDETIRLWNVSTNAPIGVPLRGHEGIVRRVTFQPQGRYLASAGRDDKKVILWALQEPDIPTTVLEGHTALLRAIAFHPQGRTLVSSDDEGNVLFWDVETGRRIGELRDIHDSKEVFDLAISRDGEMLITGGWDGKVRFWDFETREPIGEPIETGLDQVWEVELSPDGSRLAVAGSDIAVSVYDLATRTLRETFLTSSNNVNTIAFSPDGQNLAAGGADASIVIWSLTDRQNVGLPLRMHSDEVYSVVFSPDGSELVSADLSGKIFVSLIDYDDPASIACEVVSRDMSFDEWVQYIGADVPFRSSCLNSR